MMAYMSQQGIPVMQTFVDICVHFYVFRKAIGSLETSY